MPRSPTARHHFPVACFAPSIDEGQLGQYRGLLQSAKVDEETKDALESVLRCFEAWWEAPASDRKDGTLWKVKHGGREIEFRERPLTDELKEQLFESTPWLSELDRLGNAAGDGLFDRLPNGPLRDAAFHLLWYAKEITNDREPLTADVLAGE
jgi:hypothetical protein